MIFKTITTFIRRLIAGANVTTVLLMLAFGFSGHLSPLGHPTLTQAHFLFPTLVIVNLLFLFFWILFKPRLVVISLAGMLAAFMPMRHFCPVNLPTEATADTFKVLSFNVEGFACTTLRTDEERSQLPRYIAGENADVVCLQESYYDAPTKKLIASIMTPVYPYSETEKAHDKGNPMEIYSKHPIVGKEHIEYGSSSNHSTVFYLLVGEDTLVVINNHLQSLQLSSEDREGFQSMVEGAINNSINSEYAKEESHKLFDKIRDASVVRTPQAETVAQLVDSFLDRGLSVIVCGDFNDPPLSYTCRTIGRRLTDCYAAAGNGPGFSYHENGMLVRIDHIFCSADWQPVTAKVDRKMGLSDHYPIKCTLKRVVKP